MNAQRIAIELKGVSKQYKLGQIGGGSLQADLQSWWARRRGKDDPNTLIGQEHLRYGEIFMALNDINLTINKGERLGIIGRNGAGKSTLLKLLSRVTAPTKGVIDIYGRVASMLEVGTGFNGEMTGRENIYMNGAILGMTKREIDLKMEDIIRFSEVSQFIDTPVKRYSSGMYVKLAFSVAVHLDSEILIMDEVLAVGDMAFQKKCLDRMKQVASQEGRTVLYVSHNMNTIRQLCERCIVLDKGQIIYDGTVDNAIQIYMGELAEARNHYVFSKEQHAGWISEEDYIFQETEIIDRREFRCSSGEDLKIRLRCTKPRLFSRPALRLEISSQSGEVVGIMLASAELTFSKAQEDFYIRMPTEHLAPGKYNVSMVAYYQNEFGNQQLLDGVYPAFLLEIDENDGTLIWDKRYWGHVRFHDIEILN